MARVKGIAQLYLPPTRLSTNEMSHPGYIPSSTASSHFGGTHYPSHRG